MKSQFKEGVSLLSDYKDNISYRCSCSCGDNEHDIVMDFEIDEHFGINLNFYKTISYSHYWIYRDPLWYDKFQKMIIDGKIFKAPLYLFNQIFGYYFRCGWNRLKTTIKILFTGYIKLESDFILEGDQLDNFILALQEGGDILKSRREKLTE